MAVFIAMLLAVRPVMAGDSLESRLVQWRKDSTLLSGSAARALIQRQFIAFDPSYLEQRKLFAPKITAAAEKIRESEEAGRPLPARRKSISKPSGCSTTRLTLKSLEECWSLSLTA
jgi:hypothetical protein